MKFNVGIRGATGEKKESKHILRRSPAFLAAFLVVSLVGGGIALADNLAVDGDGDAPVAAGPMNLGDICLGSSASRNALLAVRRASNSTSANVFKNGTAVTVSVGSVPLNVTAIMGADSSITLPLDWTSRPINFLSTDVLTNPDSASSTVAVTGVEPLGGQSAVVSYNARGLNINDVLRTQTGTLTVNWNVISCDTTPPVITPNVTGTMGSNGWYTSNVDVTWTVNDPESAISSTTGCGPTTISADTAGQTLTCSATSLGGTASQSVTVKRDTTAPTIGGAATTMPNGNGWYDGSVDVEFTCSDGTSGVATCGPNQTLSSDGANLSATGTATDNAGNTASTAVSGINIDTTAPSVSASANPGPNGAGWNNGSVSVSFSGTDLGGSGIDTCDAPVVLSGDGAGQSAMGSCSDLAGNSASATASDINIDTVAPSVSLVGGPQAGQTYYFGSVPAAPTCSASDALSGLAGLCAVGGYSAAIGSHTVSTSAADKAGNTASAYASYTVAAWTLQGFFAPVNMDTGSLNSVKGGSTVPLKFRIFAGPTELTDTVNIKSFGSKIVPCPGSADVDPVDELTPAGQTVLRYDTTGGQFIYNWKTPKNPGKCYTVTMTTLDGSTISAHFKLT